jgi:4-hydroxy-4-methyl-2-oxoglutarate aldolase
MTVSSKTLPDALLARALARSSATLHEAGKKIGALPAAIKPHAADVRVCGRAFPVKSPPGDNLWLHHAIYAAGAGDVLVIDVGVGREFGYWGEVMAVAAQARAIAGLVINGGTRDGQQMLHMQFPVFSTALCIRGTGKDVNGVGSLGAPITIGDVTIVRGDLVFGDSDGVVVLPAERAEEIVDAGERRDAEEEDFFRRLKNGQTTLQIYDLPFPGGLKDDT